MADYIPAGREKMSIFTEYSRAGTEDIRMLCWQGLWRQRTGAISPSP